MMGAMANDDWKHLGHLTPDTPECQREVWALLGWIQKRLGDVLEEVATRTAEPTWAATLRDGVERSLGLAVDLTDEAGEDAREHVGTDETVANLDGSLGEVLSSGHMPSLLACGYGVLGELGAVPARLLEEVAGPHGRLLLGRVVSSESHRPLARLLAITHPAPRDQDNLRRMLRHLNGEWFTVLQSWRQTFHTLGVDGEWIDESCLAGAQAAAVEMGLPFTRADQRVFSPAG